MLTQLRSARYTRVICRCSIVSALAHGTVDPQPEYDFTESSKTDVLLRA